MDEYLDHLRRYLQIEEGKKPDTPLWHIHAGGTSVPEYGSSINFTMVNNLVSALGSPNAGLMREFLTRYDEGASRYPEVIDSLVRKGMDFYNDRILPNKRYREPTAKEREFFALLATRLGTAEVEVMDEKQLQSVVFDLARELGAEPKDFFAAIYQVLLGQEQGPRFGTFARLVGPRRVAELIAQRMG
jgi:lysyl-tRNA synthetase class 1